jgi:cytochrome c553
MEPIAASLTSKQMSDLARHYARLKGSASPSSNETQKSIQRGEKIARNGIPKNKVAGCADCHGSKEAPMNPLYPTLNGQHADYLILQLTLFKQGHRGGTSNANLMHKVVAGMDVDDIRDVAQYYASLQLAAPQAK